MIIGATIPVVLVGFAGELCRLALADIGNNLAWANIAFAGLLWAADRFGGQLHGLSDMRWSAAMGIGLMQICALIPGRHVLASP